MYALNLLLLHLQGCYLRAGDQLLQLLGAAQPLSTSINVFQESLPALPAQWTLVLHSSAWRIS